MSVQAFVAGHDRAAGDELDNQAEGLEDRRARWTVDSDMRSSATSRALVGRQSRPVVWSA